MRQVGHTTTIAGGIVQEDARVIGPVGALAVSALLGASHAAADGSAGWLLGSLSVSRPGPEIAGYLLLYNLLAFVAQPVWGFVIDRLGGPRLAAIGGMIVQLAGLLLGSVEPWLAVGLSGLGSGLFHVGAGGLALMLVPGRASGVGLFAAPGVLGLGVGGALAVAGYPAAAGLGWVLAGLALAQVWCVPAIQVARADRDARVVGNRAGSDARLELHDVLMVLLLAGIALRSLVWTAFNWIVEGESGPLLALAGSACAGKLAGGFLADRFGWRSWSVFALGMSALLAILGVRNPAVACLSAGLLQSATPAAAAALVVYLPGRPALAAGLSFGLAIAIGGAPFILGLGPGLLNAPVLVLALLLAALAGMLGIPRALPLPAWSAVNDRE